MDGWENMIGGDMDVCTLKRNRDKQLNANQQKTQRKHLQVWPKVLGKKLARQRNKDLQE